MKARFSTTLIWAALLCGCSAGLWGKAPLTAEDFQRKAAALEEGGELQQALTAWHAASLLNPEDPQIAAAIRSLEKNILENAQAHFNRGLDLFQAGHLDAARREFLTVLRLWPGHPRANYYLKVRLNNPELAVHRVQRGESFARIAAEHYKDSGKAQVLAYYNELDPGKPLPIDTLLLLPSLRPEQLNLRRPGEEGLERAQKALELKQYREALAICDRIRLENPSHPRLQALTDAARLGWANALLDQKEHLAAMEQLKLLGPECAGREQALRRARALLQQQDAHEKLRQAETRLEQGAFEAALGLCEEVLAQDPTQAKAKTLLQAVRYQWGKKLLEQGKDAQAITVLRELDGKYQDSAQLLALAQARLNARAEEFYRKGVKFFLNEELEQAIQFWQKALALNPAHPKARQDMDNALRLLDKWRGLDRGEAKGN